MNLKTAINGLLITLTAEGYSPRTSETYELHLRCLASYFENGDVDSITSIQLREWLVWLRDAYLKHRGKRLTSKSVYNHRTSMRRFFRFALAEQLVKVDPALAVKAPRYQSPSPNPFSAEEIERILKGCGAPKTKTAYQNRNRLMVVMLEDTGIRASELLGLNLSDIDLKRQRMLVLGKGEQETLCAFW